MVDEKQILKISLLGAFVISVLGYILLTVAGDGQMSIAESDQLLYMQYARNMAHGHPLVFSPGDAPSTGSTTYLYIFLHSLIYRLGAEGDLVYLLSYLMNATFYLGSIWMIWNIARIMIPGALGLTMSMSVLSFHLAAASLKQTDIGLFVFLALALFASLLHKKFLWSAIFATLCGLARPEGFVFAFAFFCCSLLKLAIAFFSNKQLADARWKKWLLFSGLGFMGFASTLLINFIYTGKFQFMSVAHKGYFNAYPLSGAIQLTLIESVRLIKGVFFGLQNGHRQFYFFPVLAGLLGLIGMVFRKRDAHSPYIELWFGLSAIGSILLIASSQFSGISNDRYLAWMLPVWSVYIITGLLEITKHFKLQKHALIICATLLLGYQVIGLINQTFQTHGNCVSWEARKAFALEIKETVPTSETIACTAGSSISYYVPEHKIYNVWGITSPEFHHRRKGDVRELFTIIDLIRHNPHLKFDYWLTNESALKAYKWLEDLIGECVLSDPDQGLIADGTMSLYKADWALLDGGYAPALCKEELQGLSIIDSLDVGYFQDEEDHHYNISTRLKSTRISPIYLKAELAGKDHMENGRLIFGHETFIIKEVDPGKPLFVILRTGIETQAGAHFNRQTSSIERLLLNKDLHLRIFIDGAEAEIPAFQLNDSGFSEIVMRLPPDLLSNDAPEIKVLGDHISYAYWFAQ